MIKNFSLLFLTIFTAISLWSCSGNKSYAEMLEDENKAVNRFLADQRAVDYFPEEDYETGENAPFYQLDEEGNIFMQIIRVGTGEMAEDNQEIYFRFMRYNLMYYSSEYEMAGEGNSDNPEYGNVSFRYKNFTLTSSSQWGEGIQMPLQYLPIGSEVKIVIKSQYGWEKELAYVQPYLYHIRYYASKI